MPYRSVTTAGITLLCFPPLDRAFSETVLQLVADGDVRTPDDLETKLQNIYPRVVARARDSLAAMGGGEQAWYVYRDGRYSPYAADPDWWRDGDAARITIDEVGHYLDANPQALEMLGVDLVELRAAPPGSFTPPEARERIPWLLALLEEIRVLESTAILISRDGRRSGIQYRLMLDGAGAGRHVNVMRTIPIEDLDEAAGTRSPAGAPGAG